MKALSKVSFKTSKMDFINKFDFTLLPLVQSSRYIVKTKRDVSYGILSYLQMTVICKDFFHRVPEIYIKNPSPLTSGYIDFIHFI